MTMRGRGLSSQSVHGGGGVSRRLWSVVETRNLNRSIDRPADHLDRRSLVCSGGSRCQAITASCNVG